MKRAVTTILCAFLCLFCACGKEGYIPDGKYADRLTDTYVLYEGEDLIEFYWEIEGNKAEYYASRALTYKCNIVEENEVLYFEGYTWKSLFSSKEQGAVFKYRIVYDEENKSITLFK